MAKYQVGVTLEGYIELEAESEAEARDHAEDGFSVEQFRCTDTDIGEITLIKE